MAISTTTVSGLYSSLDWTTVIDKLVEIESIPKVQMQTEQATNTTRSNLLTGLATKFSSLQTAVKSLQSTDLFNARTVSSSTADSAWSMNAATGTATGTYTIAVNQLATAAKRVGTADISRGLSTTADVSSLTLASLPTAVAPTAGTFSVNGNKVTVALTDSLKDVFDKISAATGSDVTASYDPATDKITLHSASNQEIVLGAANDTSNLLGVLRLANNGSDTVSSASTLGAASSTATLANARFKANITNVDTDGKGSFTVNGTKIDYNINSDSMAAVLARITSSDAGVNATYDAAADRILLVNKTTGDTGVNISEGAGGLVDALGLGSSSSLSRGKNALFTVNGGDVFTSSSNTLDSSVHGITGFSVTVNTQTTQSLTIANDATSQKSAIDDFITAYNDVQDYISTETAITSENGKVKTGGLAYNREVEGLASSLRDLAFGAVSTAGSLSRLSDLGIDFVSGSDKLAIKDSAKLASALANKSTAVSALFTTGSTGLAAKLGDLITKTIGTSGTDGTLGEEVQSLTKANSSLDEQIAAMDRRLEQTRELLTSAFTAMEAAQAKAKNVLSQLDNAFGKKSDSSS